MYVRNECVNIKKYSCNKMSSHEVNEATAALKGMLGIGSNTPTQKSETATTPVKEEQSLRKKKKNQRSKKKKQNMSQNTKEDEQMTSKEGSETFAWSAFQASPDASALPMPAFSPAPTRPTINAETVSDLAAIVPDDNNVVDTPRTKDTSVVEKTDRTVSPVEEESVPVSNTGINLAALTASPPSRISTSPPPRQTATRQAAYEPIPHHAPHYPPPHVMTIHVQVPPVLLPGRQMVVASPMGYPVQVTVPEGIPPGMVIPVVVPALPAHMMPGQAPPPLPHMMPGPAPAPHMMSGPYPPYGYPPPPP